MKNPRTWRVLAGVVALLACAGLAFWALRGSTAFRSGYSPVPVAPIASDAGGETIRTESGASDGSAPSAAGVLHGRVATVDGATYEGPLRWGRSEEAFWTDYFNGVRLENAWLARVPPDRRPVESDPWTIFGFEIAKRERPSPVRRPFLARFGEIARIEGSARQVLVALKSGSQVVLDRFEASDFDDGVRVWDGERGVVDIDTLRIRSVDFSAAPPEAESPARAHGTVRTTQGDLTGFIAWNRTAAVGSDELVGRTDAGDVGLRLGSIRAIVRRGIDGATVTLRDGREVLFGGGGDFGPSSRGIQVVDERFGQVVVAWSAFERVDFDAAFASGPGYADFRPGGPLTGSVTTHDGRRLAGRLVYDLDESETTDTLDAPRDGLDYTLPFGRVTSIARAGDAHVRVGLAGGETLDLEAAGDLGDAHAGVLVFADGAASPEYVTWSEIERVELDRPLEIATPLARP